MGGQKLAMTRALRRLGRQKSARTQVPVAAAPHACLHAGLFHALPPTICSDTTLQVADTVLLGSCTFPTFLVGEMQDLRKVRPIARTQAEREQRRVGRQLRDALRKLLRSAAQRGMLPWGAIHIADFAASGEVQAPSYVALDEDLAGDSEFNPVNLDPSTPAASATALTPLTNPAAPPTSGTAWLVVQSSSPTWATVGATVANYAGLLTWGPATVLELNDATGQQARCLGVTGSWHEVSLLSAPFQWQPFGRGDALYFGTADEPHVTADVPRVIEFAAPLVEDATHSHTFYFDSASVWRRAAAVLELDTGP